MAGTKAGEVAVKTDAIDKASKRLVYTVVLSDDEGQFKFGKSALPDEAKAKIDGIGESAQGRPEGRVLEIEGYTDSVGGKVVNERIGLERAENVKRYLFEQHQIPLHKMNVISYGPPIPWRRTRRRRACAKPPDCHQGSDLTRADAVPPVMPDSESVLLGPSLSLPSVRA